MNWKNYISEYEKAAKILEEKESKVKLAKIDATIHTLSAKEHQVSKKLTQVNKQVATVITTNDIIAENDRIQIKCIEIIWLL